MKQSVIPVVLTLLVFLSASCGFPANYYLGDSDTKARILQPNEAAYQNDGQISFFLDLTDIQIYPAEFDYSISLSYTIRDEFVEHPEDAPAYSSSFESILFNGSNFLLLNLSGIQSDQLFGLDFAFDIEHGNFRKMKLKLNNTGWTSALSDELADITNEDDDKYIFIYGSFHVFDPATKGFDDTDFLHLGYAVIPDRE